MALDTCTTRKEEVVGIKVIFDMLYLRCLGVYFHSVVIIKITRSEGEVGQNTSWLIEAEYEVTSIHLGIPIGSRS